MNIYRLSPLTESSFYVLLVLCSPNHGYGITKEVQRMTHERLKLAPGTLYGIITAFLTNHLIELVNYESHRSKKTYIITNQGKELLKYEIQRLNELVENAKEVNL